jgi:hypothetical protein
MKTKIDTWVPSLESEIQLSTELIEMALQKTPTGGNAKQFHWIWNDNQLTIEHDSKLAEHYLNPNNHASWIALGCLLESVDVAAKAQGWITESLVSENVGARVIFFRMSKKESGEQGFESLINRTTYRGKFSPSFTPKLNIEHQLGIQTKVVSASDLTKEFKNYLLQTDTYLWLQKQAMVSFFKEIRFFDYRLNPRGVRSADLGVGTFDQITLYIFSFLPWLLSILVRIPLLNRTFKAASRKNLENAHFVLITATELNPIALVRSGQEAMAAWLQLESQGYKAQPYTLASLTLVAAKTGNLPEDTMKKFRDLFLGKGRKVVKDQFNLLENENPVWLLRAGKI